MATFGVITIIYLFPCFVISAVNQNTLGHYPHLSNQYQLLNLFHTILQFIHIQNHQSV